MDLVAGTEYTFDILVDVGPFGKRKAVAKVIADNNVSFHGYGQLVDEPFSFAGVNVGLKKKLRFRDGQVNGDTMRFTVKGKKMVVNFKVKADDQGNINGVAELAGVLKARLSGAVSNN